MDIDTAREYLSEYRILSARVKRLRAMQRLNPENYEKYEKEIRAAITVRDNIEKDIDNVDGGILSEVLASKYILGKTLEETALIIGYCKRQTERLHLKALKLLKTDLSFVLVDI